MTAQLAEGPRASGLRPVDRLVVAALCSALPPHFRARQRAEWTADLLILARQGTVARLRYLLGAAWTLPTLRSLARHSRADGPQAVLQAASPATVIVARVLLIGLTWVVLSWLIMVPGRYLWFDIPTRMASGAEFDPKSIWPGGDQPAYLLPVLVVLYWGALAATLDFPFVPVVALIASGFVALRRSAPWPEWLRQALLRVTIIGAVAVPLTGLDMFFALMSTGGWFTVSLAATTAMSLSAFAHGLSKPTRFALGLLGAAALATVIVNHTVGQPMVVWFHD